jgi:hypothetical protein
MLGAIGGSNILYVHICSNLLDLVRISSSYCRSCVIYMYVLRLPLSPQDDTQHLQWGHHRH